MNCEMCDRDTAGTPLCGACETEFIRYMEEGADLAYAPVATYVLVPVSRPAKHKRVRAYQARR